MTLGAQAYGNFHEYNEWVLAHDTIGVADRLAIRDRIHRLPQLPTFSIVLLPEPKEAVRGTASIDSIQCQLYPHWELWLPGHARLTGTKYDERVRTISPYGASLVGHAEIFNAALALAEGDFVLPLPSDALLSQHALFELAVAIGDHPETELLYTDEDLVDAAGNRYRPRFKTGWDPDLALGRDAIGLLVAYRAALLRRLGGMRFRSPDIALAFYELSLRTAFALAPGKIQHIPAILCHRRSNPEASQTWDAEGARRIVREYLSDAGVSARVVPAPLAPRWSRIVRDLPSPAPLISVIVPTRDRPELLERCADMVLSRTDYPRIELLILDNDSREAATVALLERLSQDTRVRIRYIPGPFNYSRMNNLAAQDARGEILLLLNNDTGSLRPDWLREMVSHAVRPDVGAVGAKLLYADGRVQHAGIVLGPGVTVVHQFRFAGRSDANPSGELALARTISAVTGACLALRRSVFFEVGGLDEKLSMAYNDVDLCMRIGDHGYRVVWTPFAEVCHLESASRGYDITPEKQAFAADEAKYFSRSWGSLLDSDPFHNPNLTYGWETVRLSTPPRRERPWKCGCLDNQQ